MQRPRRRLQRRRGETDWEGERKEKIAKAGLKEIFSISIFSAHGTTVFFLFACSKDARLPEQLQRAMAAEAEASREARAKVIAADGEMRASKALKEASLVIDQSPSALQLRYLQVETFPISQLTVELFSSVT